MRSLWMKTCAFSSPLMKTSLLWNSCLSKMSTWKKCEWTYFLTKCSLAQLHMFNIFYLIIGTSTIQKFRRKIYFYTSLDLSELQIIHPIKANVAKFGIHFTPFTINEYYIWTSCDSWDFVCIFIHPLTSRVYHPTALMMKTENQKVLSCDVSTVLLCSWPKLLDLTGYKYDIE